MDWLRVITILCVFAFHSARFFDSFSDWHVRNTTTWLGADIIVGFLNMWIMPMFMVLAGASTYYSLRSRSSGKYIRERILRLLVPFVFGIFIINAPQSYYERLSHGSLLNVTFWEFYPRYLGELPERFIHFSFYHLWFLAVLFIFSLICLPLFAGLYEKGKSPLSRLAFKIDSRWKLMLFLILPLAIINILVYPGTFWGTRDFGGWCICAHLLFFISGYVIFANPEIVELMRKLVRVVSIGAIAGAVALGPVIGQMFNWKRYFGSPGYALGQVAISLLSWCLIVLIINATRKRLNFKNRFLAYAGEAVLPFYILHQTVIIVVGYYVVGWQLHPAVKYLIIAPAAFCVIMALYDLLIKRITILRFLFGMRPAAKPAGK